ncbi:MAG: glycosyltransferase [Patescibacteria group bacterium]
MKLVINIPAFNEEAKIAETISRIPKSFSGISEIFVQVIDDGSKDKTIEKAKAGGADAVYPNGINRGIGVVFRNAVQRALENGADIMVNIDADGQFDPKDIQKLIDPILSYEADMVSADRFGKHVAKNIPKVKDYLNRFAAFIIGKFLNTKINDLTCGFRAYSRETLLRLNLPGNFTYTQETIIDALGKNLKIKWVPVVVTYFAERKSRVVKSVWNYVNNSFRIILKAVRDVRPMKFFGIPGFVMISASLILLIIFLSFYFQDFKISPYRNYLTFAIGLFLIGLQFIIFALIADMIKSNRKLNEEEIYLLKKERYKK